MASIATLMKQKDGGFLGTLSTPALHAAKIAFATVENPTDKGPVYRVLPGESEIGAGWKRTSKAGNAYISVKLRDPSFARPIYCPPVKSEQAGYTLQWDRQTPKKFGSQNTSHAESTECGLGFALGPPHFRKGEIKCSNSTTSKAHRRIRTAGNVRNGRVHGLRRAALSLAVRPEAVDRSDSRNHQALAPGGEHWSGRR